jgi:hypothetical protein
LIEQEIRRTEVRAAKAKRANGGIKRNLGRTRKSKLTTEKRGARQKNPAKR